MRNFVATMLIFGLIAVGTLSRTANSATGSSPFSIAITAKEMCLKALRRLAGPSESNKLGGSKKIDPTILDLSTLPPYEQEIYAFVRRQPQGGLFGWEDSRTLPEVYLEVGFFRAALMSSLERLLYGDGLWEGPAGARWLDVGSGTGQVARDFQSSSEASTWRLNHDVEIIGVEPNATDLPRGGVYHGGPVNVRGGDIARGARSKPNERIRFIQIAKVFEEVPDSALGQFTLITSIRAATYYSPRLTFVINKMLRARSQSHRLIFDVRNADVVETQLGTKSLTDWLFEKLKPVSKHVEKSESYKHPGVTFFLISDVDLKKNAGQIPELVFKGLDQHQGFRIFREP